VTSFALAVVGARPNFMKAAPVIDALRRRGLVVELVHTGQHYDANMSDAFFRDLELPTPDHFLGVGSGTHAQQTARVMESFEPVVLERKPRWVVVFGDVNSTIACALVTVKLKPTLGTRVAHVEAGLRSGDWRMPEEVNRVVTDRVSDLLLAPSIDALPNLEREGIPSERVRMVGNVMIDTLLKWLPRARERRSAEAYGLKGGRFILVTLHRPSNVDEKGALETILKALDTLGQETRIVFPMHPRTRKQVSAFGLDALLRHVTVIDPVGYLEMLALEESAALALTDSGGVQEETTVLGVPCLTLREQTERPITLDGTNRMATWPLTVDGIISSAREALATPRVAVGSKSPEGWDGRASERVADALTEFAA
jgi:UDP-N-acetylglucosamine 2-epimerase (non-hydrolysing)